MLTRIPRFLSIQPILAIEPELITNTHRQFYLTLIDEPSIYGNLLVRVGIVTKSYEMQRHVSIVAPWPLILNTRYIADYMLLRTYRKQTFYAQFRYTCALISEKTVLSIVWQLYFHSKSIFGIALSLNSLQIFKTYTMDGTKYHCKWNIGMSYEGNWITQSRTEGWVCCWRSHRDWANLSFCGHSLSLIEND